MFDSGDPERSVDYGSAFRRGTNGTYEFVCEPHASAGMVGQITIAPAAPLNETTEEEQPVSVDTPSLSMVATVGVLALAGWLAPAVKATGEASQRRPLRIR